LFSPLRLAVSINHTSQAGRRVGAALYRFLTSMIATHTRHFCGYGYMLIGGRGLFCIDQTKRSSKTVSLTQTSSAGGLTNPCSCTYMYVHSLKRAYIPSHQFSLMLVRQV
jgi:hypothetical protein